jgi:hypothetical protein
LTAHWNAHEFWIPEYGYQINLTGFIICGHITDGRIQICICLQNIYFDYLFELVATFIIYLFLTFVDVQSMTALII